MKALLWSGGRQDVKSGWRAQLTWVCSENAPLVSDCLLSFHFLSCLTTPSAILLGFNTAQKQSIHPSTDRIA